MFRLLSASVFAFILVFKIVGDHVEVTFEHENESETVTVPYNSDRDKMTKAAHKKLKTFKIPPGYALRGPSDGEGPCLVVG
jgi:hypothetical protein